MEIILDRDILLKSLSHAYGIIEKKSTLPILSNVLIEAKDSKVKITGTDLDIIFSEEIQTISIKKEGSIVKVYSDSKYVVDTIEKKWVFAWEEKNFNKKKNPDLWIRFLKIYRHRVFE